MKKQTIIKLFTVAVFLAFFLINVGTARCEPPSNPFREARSNLRKALPRLDTSREQNLEQENHERFQLVEWLIQQSLLKQYQRLEIDLDLEDNLD